MGTFIAGNVPPEEFDSFHELIVFDELARCGSVGVHWGGSLMTLIFTFRLFESMFFILVMIWLSTCVVGRSDCGNNNWFDSCAPLWIARNEGACGQTSSVGQQG